MGEIFSFYFFFLGASMSLARKHILQLHSSMKVGALPFTYLGVTFLKGALKVSYVKPIVDKISH